MSEVKTRLSDRPEFAAMQTRVLQEGLKFQQALAHHAQAESDYVGHLKTQLMTWRIYGIGMTIVVVALTCLL